MFRYENTGCVKILVKRMKLINIFQTAWDIWVTDYWIVDNIFLYIIWYLNYVLYIE